MTPRLKSGESEGHVFDSSEVRRPSKGETRCARACAAQVEDTGPQIGRNKGSPTSPTNLSAAYDEYAARDPLGLARALVRCLKALTDGGFLLSDFHASQFTLKARDIYQVDGPALHSGPLADAIRKRYPTQTRRHRARVPPDAAWVLPPNGRCTADSECPRTKPFHSCALPDACEPGSSGAPETAGKCLRHFRKCDGDLGPKVHVYDLAAKAWLFPRIIALAEHDDDKAKLRGLSNTMLNPRPEDRPSFDDVLAALPPTPTRRTRR